MEFLDLTATTTTTSQCSFHLQPSPWRAENKKTTTLAPSPNKKTPSISIDFWFLFPRGLCLGGEKGLLCSRFFAGYYDVVSGCRGVGRSRKRIPTERSSSGVTPTRSSASHATPPIRKSKPLTGKWPSSTSRFRALVIILKFEYGSLCFLVGA